MQDRKLPWIDRMLRPLVRHPALYRATEGLLWLAMAFCFVWPFVVLHDARSVFLFPVGLVVVEVLYGLRRVRRRYRAWLDLMVRVYVRPVHPIRRGRR